MASPLDSFFETIHTTNTLQQRSDLTSIFKIASGSYIGGTRIFTNAGSPAGTVTAARIGDMCVDYTNHALYMATATGTGSWTAFAGLSTLASGATIGGVSYFTDAGAPGDTALQIGDIAVDYTNGAFYMAQATGSSGWVRLGVTSTSGSPFSLSTTANAIGIADYWTTAATSGTTYGRYNKLTATAAGVEAIAGRDRTVLSAAAANAHGAHGTLEVTSTGYVTGLGTGKRGNIVFATDTVVPYGTYYGVLAEIYPIGNTGTLPAASNACLGINAQSGTANDLVVNAIAFNGADGTGKMIYTHSITPAGTAITSIKVRVNGVIGYMYVYSAQ